MSWPATPAWCRRVPGAEPMIDFCRRTMVSDLARKMAETFATKVMVIGIGLVTSVLVTRSLGPVGRGLFAVAGTVTALAVQFGNLGLHASNTYYVAQDRKLLGPLTANSLCISILLGGLIAVGALGVADRWPSLAPIHGAPLQLALLAVPLGLTYMLLQNLLLGIGEVRAYNSIELTAKILTPVCYGLLIVAHFVSVPSVLTVGLVTAFLSCALALGRLRRNLSRRLAPSLSLFCGSIGYGLRAYVGAFFAFLVIRIDMLMVQYMLGARQSGYYSIAVTIADMVYLVPATVATILFPKLSSLSTTPEKWALTSKITRAAGALLLLSVIATAALAQPAVCFLYGSAFLPSVPAVWWLMPGILFLGVETVACQFLASIGLPAAVPGIWTFCALFNIGFNFIAIRRFGMVGAAISSSVTYFLAMGLIFWLIMKHRRQPKVC